MVHLVLFVISLTLSACINTYAYNHAKVGSYAIICNILNYFVITIALVCAFIAAVVKANLPDDIDYKSYKNWALKEYVKNESNTYKKILANLYIYTNFIISFVGGWFMGIYSLPRH